MCSSMPTADTMDTAEAAARRELTKALNGAFYKTNVDSGKQQLYRLKNRDNKREKSILKQLPESKIHLLPAVLKRLSAEIGEGKKSSARLISACIYKCENECDLAASVSGGSETSAVSSTNATSTTTTTEDTPSQVPANKSHHADRNTSPIVSKNESNATTALAAAGAPADGAALITPDKPGDQTNDGVDPSSSASGDTSTSYLSDDDFVHFSDTEGNPNSVSASSIESESESESDQDPAPKSTKKRRLTREVDALVRSRPGSLPLDGNDWKQPVQTMALWKAYGLDKVCQQPTSISLLNAGQFPFYEAGTGISRIDLCFVPPNTRFTNDGAMDKAAIAARALVADEFGGDELLNQRDRKYSAPNFHTAFYMDKTCATCPVVHDQGINNSCETFSPMNKCISAAYFTKLEGSGSGSACMWIEWLVTAKDYRNRKLGIGKLLLKNILHLALIDEGVDGVYLEVGNGSKAWEAARHVYISVGFDVVGDLRALPKSVEERCKHFGDHRCDILHFDCEKNKNMFEDE